MTGAAEVDPGEKPLWCSILKDIYNVSRLNDRLKWSINPDGKAFRISPITASRTFDCISRDSFLRVPWIFSRRWVIDFWKRFSIPALRFSQASNSSGNRVLSPIVCANDFKVFSSRVSERHSTNLSFLVCDFLRKALR